MSHGCLVIFDKAVHNFTLSYHSFKTFTAGLEARLLADEAYGMSGRGGTMSDSASSDKEQNLEEAVAAAAAATSPPSGPAAAKVPKPSKKEAASAFSQSGDKDGQTGVTKCARSDPPEVAEFLSADMYGGLPPLESASEEEEVYQTRGSAHCHFFVNC